MLTVPLLRRWLRRLAVALLAGFLLVTYTPLPVLMSRPLVLPAHLRPADVIIVLGSGAYPDSSLSAETLQRTVHGIRLFRRGLAPRLVFTGGLTYSHVPPLAHGMARLAIDLGVGADSVMVEKMSTSTYENARNVRAILVRHGWRTALLVTSAPHSRRAVLAFRKQGIDVYPAPVAFYERYRFSVDGQWNLFKSACHEYIGLVYYRWRGWI